MEKTFPEWTDIERFDVKWKGRIKEMAHFIPKRPVTVVDLGCGPMWLEEMLSPTITYLPVDFRSRGDKTLIMDFNKKEFPDFQYEVSFVSGCLEYIQDYRWFIHKICEQSQMCILSYCVLENYPNLKERKKNAWVNHLTESEIISIFTRAGFQLVHLKRNDNQIFVFKKNNAFENTAH